MEKLPPANHGKQATPENKWFLFNDDVVKAWDPTELALNCFGGPEDATHLHASQRQKLTARNRHYNAYLLFYERIAEAGGSSVLRSPSENDNIQSERAPFESNFEEGHCAETRSPRSKLDIPQFSSVREAVFHGGPAAVPQRLCREDAASLIPGEHFRYNLRALRRKIL